MELQENGIYEQKIVNFHLKQLSKELEIELAATNDVHYLFQEDAETHDVLLCIQTNAKVNDEKPNAIFIGQFLFAQSRGNGKHFFQTRLWR